MDGGTGIRKNDFLTVMRSQATNVFGAIGFHVDYTPESLFTLEQKMSEMYPDRTPKAIPMLVGYYLGETIVRHVPGATWVHPDPEEEPIITIKVQNGMAELRPITRAFKFFQDRTDGLVPMFQMSATLAVVAPENVKSLGTELQDGWIGMPGGFMIRTTVVKDE